MPCGYVTSPNPPEKPEHRMRSPPGYPPYDPHMMYGDQGFYQQQYPGMYNPMGNYPAPGPQAQTNHNPGPFHHVQAFQTARMQRPQTQSGYRFVGCGGHYQSQPQYQQPYVGYKPVGCGSQYHQSQYQHPHAGYKPVGCGGHNYAQTNYQPLYQQPQLPVQLPQQSFPQQFYPQMGAYQQYTNTQPYPGTYNKYV